MRSLWTWCSPRGSGIAPIVRASQILASRLARLVAIVMISGLWQMQVFLDQGTNEAWERTKLDPVALSSVVSSDNTVSDGYDDRSP